MDESGKSSAVDYDISHPVVEDLVSHIQQQPGVLGARMMGGGNGGPALVLLEKDRLEAVRASLATFYARHPISQPDRAFHACRFGPGAHREPF
jgi:galactokinase